MDFVTMLSMLTEGFVVTLQIFACTLVGALPLGVLVALCRMSRFTVLSALTRVYISIMRGTPLMLQLMFIYFAPWYVFGVQLSTEWKFGATIVAFVLNYSAYFAEIYRSGIQSMPLGQYEAAKILGYGRGQTFFLIILPQVVKRILPSVTNEIITLVKDTSLAFTLSVMEMFTIAKAIAAAQTTMAPFIAAGLFYYIFNLLVAVFMEWVEKKLDYYR